MKESLADRDKRRALAAKRAEGGGGSGGGGGGGGSKRGEPRPPPSDEYEIDSDEDNRDFGARGKGSSSSGGGRGSGGGGSGSGGSGGNGGAEDAAIDVGGSDKSVLTTPSIGESKVELDLSNMREFVTSPVPYGAGVIRCYIERKKSMSLRGGSSVRFLKLLFGLP